LLLDVHFVERIPGAAVRVVVRIGVVRGSHGVGSAVSAVL
jgi:hypothetical protein